MHSAEELIVSWLTEGEPCGAGFGARFGCWSRTSLIGRRLRTQQVRGHVVGLASSGGGAAVNVPELGSRCERGGGRRENARACVCTEAACGPQYGRCSSTALLRDQGGELCPLQKMELPPVRAVATRHAEGGPSAGDGGHPKNNAAQQREIF